MKGSLTLSFTHSTNMKTEIKTLAAFLAAAMCADGVCDLNEEQVLEQIADDYDLDKVNLKAAVKDWTHQIEVMTHEQLAQVLAQHGADIVADERSIVFDCVLTIIMADSTLTRAEVNLMIAMAGHLHIALADAVLLLSDFVRHDPEVVVEY